MGIIFSFCFNKSLVTFMYIIFADWFVAIWMCPGRYPTWGLTGSCMVVQGWRSGESTRLPPVWPGFDSRDAASYVG